MSVSAPYNFVPLSCKVFTPDDATLGGAPSQDCPIEGGLSGMIPFTLTCDAPILVGRAAGDKKFMTVPDGTGDGSPAIPGSSLRGMVRNVLEIASFGKMSFVDDQRVAVRDLTAASRLDYGDRISGKMRVGQDTVYAPRSFAGWLQLIEGRPHLIPCEFGRIEHSEIDKLLDQKKAAALETDFAAKNIAREMHGMFHDALLQISKEDRETVDGHKPDEAEAVFVEDEFLELGGALEQSLFVDDARSNYTHSRQNSRLSYRLVTKTHRENTSARDGRLVFTGLPSKSKHKEFFFFGERRDLASEIDAAVWAKFVQIHDTQENRTATWKRRKKAIFAGEPIPVFWLGSVSGGKVKVSDIGLAMMFKLPADQSVKAMIGNTSERHNSAEAIDLATRIFGKISDEPGEDGAAVTQTGFKTRVSFGWATLDNKDNATPVYPGGKKTVMGRPKPSFTPAYVRQKDVDATGGALKIIGQSQMGHDIYTQYRSYMNWGAGDEIRGWKRYPVREPNTEDLPPVPAGAGHSAASPHPIKPKAGTLNFSGKIRFHNLHPVELGALLWVLTWDNSKEFYHSIGMGRNFHWGQVQFELGEIAYSNRPASNPLAAFRDRMEQEIPGWAASPQIRTLKAMASRKIGNEQSALLRQMRLEVGGDNEFRDARGRMKNGEQLPATVLPDYPLWSQAGGETAPVISDGKVKSGGSGKPAGLPPEFSEIAPGVDPADGDTDIIGQEFYYFGEDVRVTAQDGSTVSVEYADGGQDLGVSISDLKKK